MENKLVKSVFGLAKHPRASSVPRESEVTEHDQVRAWNLSFVFCFVIFY